MPGSTKRTATENAETEISKTAKKCAPPKISLHPAADLTLVIGEKQQSVKVLKSTMQTVSPVWRAMFRPEWSDSQKSTITLDEDDSNAMLILLRIAHQKHQDLPKSLTWHELQELAVACDKYDTVHVVRHVSTSLGWLKHHEKMFQYPGHASGLFFLLNFGDAQKFAAVAQDIVMNSVIDERGGLVWKGTQVNPDDHSEDLVGK